MPSSDLVLHIWPSEWNLPSYDPTCLAAVRYLQQAIPGRFVVTECSNPDLSPTGQLPFLVHDKRVVSSLKPIIKYVAGLKNAENTRASPNLDATLNQTEKAQASAWCAHVESNLGDILFNVLYSHEGNWAGLTHPALVSMYPIPQRYYIPGRIRQLYKPRLEAAGLWNPASVEEEEKKPFKEVKVNDKEKNAMKFQRAFGREKVLETARASLDIYARLVGERDFIYRDSPTTLDIILAAHLLLLTAPAYPDPFLQNLLKDSYPTLVSHAHRVYSFTSGSPQTISPAERFPWSSLIPWPPATRPRAEQSEDDIQYARVRWGFYGLALGSLAALLVSNLLIKQPTLWPSVKSWRNLRRHDGAISTVCRVITKWYPFIT